MHDNDLQLQETVSDLREEIGDRDETLARITVNIKFIW